MTPSIPDQPCRIFVESDAFVGRFGSLSEKGLFAQIANHCGAQRGGLIGEDDILLQDLNGADHIFHFETFSSIRRTNAGRLIRGQLGYCLQGSV